MREPVRQPATMTLSRRLFRLLMLFTIPVILIYLLQAPTWVNQMGWNLVPVEGQVLLEGEPVVSAKVLFVPVEPQLLTGELSPVAVGRTDPRGKFQLATLKGATGAVAGRHLVFITTWERNESGVTQRPDVVPADFRQEVEISFFGTDNLKFDLNLDQAAKPSE